MLPPSQVNNSQVTQPYGISFENSEKKENETADPIAKIGQAALQQDLNPSVSTDLIGTLTSAIGELGAFSQPVPIAPSLKEKLDQINSDAERNLPQNIEEQSQRFIQKFPFLSSLDPLALKRVTLDALNQQQYTPDDFMNQLRQLFNNYNDLVTGKKVHVGMTYDEAVSLLSGEEVGCFVIRTSQKNPRILLALVVFEGLLNDYKIEENLEIPLNKWIEEVPHMQKYVDTDGQLVQVHNKKSVTIKATYENGSSFILKYDAAGKLMSKTQL